MATAAIGHNQPPDPFEAFTLHLDDLDEQARQFLDGSPIETEAQAEDVSRILNMLRKARNDAGEARKAEKKPHDDAAKAVQAKWTPLLARAELAANVAKNVLSPWLQAKEEAVREAAEEAQREAERQAQKAREAAANVSEGDLAGQTVARALQENAAHASKQAARLAKSPVHAKGGERATGLRTYYEAEITDPVAFIRWAWAHRQSDVTAFLEGLAETEARAGPRDIPGLKMTPQRKAV